MTVQEQIKKIGEIVAEKHGLIFDEIKHTSRCEKVKNTRLMMSYIVIRNVSADIPVKARSVGVRGDRFTEMVKECSIRRNNERSYRFRIDEIEKECVKAFQSVAA